MKNVMIIFGYNNTRIYDIERIKTYCRDSFAADILLCKEVITAADQALTPYTLQINLDNRDVNIIADQVQAVDDYLAANELHPLACLPFSDKGVPLGSYFAESHGLMHDDCERSLACIDKYQFRCLEAAADTPPWYKKPFFKLVYTYQEAEAIVTAFNSPLFFKPTQEGNSRGCIAIDSIADLRANQNILDIYFKQGVIIEECIQGCDEYSFDGVNGCYVITEKKTSSGYYRVETQHVVPSPLNDFHYQRLLAAGHIVSMISGSNHGAVHNELFLNKKTGDVYCVEPNRRPGGLKLWDWISCAYPGIDNWHSWLTWASTGKKQPIKPLQHQYHVGCRMLQAGTSGTVAAINTDKLTRLHAQPDIIEIGLLKKEGSQVTSILKDNSDFIGYVVCKARTNEHLQRLLDQVASEAISLFHIQAK